MIFFYHEGDENTTFLWLFLRRQSHVLIIAVNTAVSVSLCLRMLCLLHRGMKQQVLGTVCVFCRFNLTPRFCSK